MWRIQRSVSRGTVASDHSGSSAMILLIFLKSEAGLSLAESLPAAPLPPLPLAVIITLLMDGAMIIEN